MGLSNFPSPAEGVLPLLVMNTVISVAILKNLLRSILEIMGALSVEEELQESSNGGCLKRRVSITQFKSVCENQPHECSVCLNRFDEEDEVSELSCKHFFHKGCLDKWFDNHHSTCPLCRSIY